MDAIYAEFRLVMQLEIEELFDYPAGHLEGMGASERFRMKRLRSMKSSHASNTQEVWWLIKRLIAVA